LEQKEKHYFGEMFLKLNSTGLISLIVSILLVITLLILFAEN